jgi:hypothetical protein
MQAKSGLWLENAAAGVGSGNRSFVDTSVQTLMSLVIVSCEEEPTKGIAEMATQDSARATSARDLCNLFGATSYATVVDSDQPRRYNVSVTFGGPNDEELQTVATIGFRSHGFRNLTLMR